MDHPRSDVRNADIGRAYTELSRITRRASIRARGTESVLSVVDQDRPNLILVVIVLNTADRKARLMRVVAPLGVLIPPGVSLRIDNAEAGRLSFLQCLPNGCVAQLAMDEALIAKLKNGKTATLGVFQTPEEGVGVQAPLAGFKEAYEQLP